ncbi:MAG: alpha/beta fold hydrolase [Phycisphaerales bacterium]
MASTLTPTATPIAPAPQASPSAPTTQPRKHPIRRLAFVVLRVLLITWVCWIGYLYFFQERLLFPAGLTKRTGQARLPRNAELLTIPLQSGGVVEAFLVKPRGDPPPGVGGWPAAVFFHGNAESIDDSLGHAELYTALGFACLLPEYRGYGRSAGSPSQAAIATDMARFHDLLIARPDIDASRLLYHGRSVGGAIAADLARTRPPAAMVLESTFTSVSSFCWRYGVPPILCRNPFRTDQALCDLDIPILIFHGTEDTLVPPAHGRSLRDLCKKATLVELPGDHNTFPGDWTRYEREVETFARTLLPHSGQGEPSARPSRE